MHELTIFGDYTMKDTLEKLDSTAKGVCFIIDESNKLLGVVTDGDIRRALIKGYTLESKIQDIVSKNFISLPISASNETIQRTLSKKIKYIPLVDEQNRLIDYASYYKYHRIPIYEPNLSGNELAYVTDCIQTNWISSQGKYVTKFEEQVAHYCNVPHALAVSNGTVALHLALKAFNIGEGDEVIVPDLTFAATINAVIHANATPVIVDVREDTWNIDPQLIEKAITSKTKAIIPVHLYGLPADMEQVTAIAKKHNLIVIEDAAEAIGSAIGKQRVGSFGDAAIFSFFGNKTITTGEGGMILFKNKSAYEYAKVLRDHGMSPTKKYWHEYIGYNYRITNLQAAIGVAQMEKIDKIIARKIEIGEKYKIELNRVMGLTFQYSEKDYKNTFWLISIRIKNSDTNFLLKALLQNGIDVRPIFFPLHLMPPYKNFTLVSGKIINSEQIHKMGFSLPSSVNLNNKQIEYISKTLKETVK